MPICLTPSCDEEDQRHLKKVHLDRTTTREIAIVQFLYPQLLQYQ